MKELVIEKLEAVGFTVTQDLMFEEYLRVVHEQSSFSAHIEFKGDLVIVDGDIAWDLRHGNIAGWALLAVVLPQQSILIQCSDVSHLVNRHRHPKGWGDVTEADIRRQYLSSKYNQWLYQEVHDKIEEWVEEQVAKTSEVVGSKKEG